MWADTLLAAEQAHLLRLLVWGATSVLLGSATLAMVGWHLTRNGGLVGAGLAVIIEGTALLALDLVLASAIARG